MFLCHHCLYSVRLIHRAADLPASEPPPVEKFQAKTASNPSQNKLETTSKPISHGSMDNSITTDRGNNKSSQQGQEDNQMEVDSSSSKSMVSANSGGNIAEGDTPMDVDASSSSEGVSSTGGRATTSREMGARPKDQEPEIILTAEQEKVGIFIWAPWGNIKFICVRLYYCYQIPYSTFKEI